MSNGKKVLEWVAGSPGVLAGGAGEEEETARLELGLRDDEVAEIHKVIIGSQLREDFDAGKFITMALWLSMDPNSVYAATIMKDLETILWSIRSVYGKGILVGVECVITEDKESVYTFEEPVLVGTDLGLGMNCMASVGNLDAGSTAQFRVFFTRRKATVMELNQILLKRR